MKVAVNVCLLILVSNGLSAALEVKTQDKTITKVVKLLQNMLDKSKTEGDEERKIFAKFKCYCDQSTAEKTSAIADSTKLISLLESEIEELQGSNGELSSKSADLKAAMAENKQQQEEATGIREKENKKFKADRDDFEQAIGQMKSALSTLAAVGGDQTQSTGADNKQFMAGFKGSALLSLQSSMQKAMSAAEAFMDQKQHDTYMSLMQAPFTGTYTSQSGQVVGIIKNMRDTFEANLADAIATEKSQLESYDDLMKVKTEAWNDMSKLYDEAQGALGDNDGELSVKRSQLSNAEKSKADDEEFMEKLTPMCKAKTESYEERKLLRANEEVAVAEAISILNSDSAFATFGGVSATSSGATSFLQVRRNKHFPGVSDEDVRQVMQRLLRRAAAGHKSPRLEKVQSMLQAENPFDSVLDEINEMIKVIGEEGVADKEKLDWCNTERKDNKASLKEKKGEILSLDGKIDQLNSDIDDPVKGLKAQIASTEKALEDNKNSQVTETAERQEANKAYQADVKNLVAAEDLLENAIKVLSAYYDKFDSLLQAKEDPTPPETWGKYEGQSKSGGGAIGMLEFILKETKKEESAAHAEEEKDQAEYEDSMTELKKLEAADEKSLGELQNKLATAEQELLEAEEDLKATTHDKEKIEDYLEKIKPGCDFITSNFDLRNENRKTEKTALETAMTTLKGSPAYKNAVVAATEEGYGKCKEDCVKDATHVNCQACLADVTVPGYCAGHKGTPGC
jgi:predicted  nucleic acid-binding Zn-ribbon protein